MRLLGITLVLASSTAAADESSPPVSSSACQALVAEYRWADVADCGAALAKIDAAAGAKYRRIATAEAKAEIATRDITDAIVRNDLRAARKALTAIPTTSTYHQAAKQSLDDALPATYSCTPGTPDRPGGSCLCPLTHSPVRDSFNQAICKTDPCRNGAAVAATKAKADTAMSSGNYAQAMSEYDKILSCNPQFLKRAFLAACRARYLPRAKIYFKQLPKADQDKFAQACIPQFAPD